MTTLLRRDRGLSLPRSHVHFPLLPLIHPFPHPSPPSPPPPLSPSLPLVSAFLSVHLHVWLSHHGVSARLPAVARAHTRHVRVRQRRHHRWRQQQQWRRQQQHEILSADAAVPGIQTAPAAAATAARLRGSVRGFRVPASSSI